MTGFPVPSSAQHRHVSCRLGTGLKNEPLHIVLLKEGLGQLTVSTPSHLHFTIGHLILSMLDESKALKLQRTHKIIHASFITKIATLLAHTRQKLHQPAFINLFLWATWESQICILAHTMTVESVATEIAATMFGSSGYNHLATLT